MSTKYLGRTFDIHGGGLDLKFPHHECEVAQGKGCFDTDPVRYWMHANMLTMNGQRMSKSTGNFVLPLDLVNGDNPFFDKPFDPAVVRFCFLQAHYRSVLDLSNEAMLASEKGFHKLMEGMRLLPQLPSSSASTLDLTVWIGRCYAAMNDDFNTPILMAQLFEGIRMVRAVHEGTETLTVEDVALLRQTLEAFVFEVLGLTDVSQSEGNNQRINGVIALLIRLRKQARDNKDWALSDQIRDELAELGIQLKDGKEGTTFTWQ